MFRLLFCGLKGMDEVSINKLVSKKRAFITSLVLMGIAMIIGISMIITSGLKILSQGITGMDDYGFWIVFAFVITGQLFFVVSICIALYGRTKALFPKTKTWVYILLSIAVYYAASIFSLALILITILLKIPVFIGLFILCWLLLGIYIWIFVNLFHIVLRLSQNPLS